MPPLEGGTTKPAHTSSGPRQGSLVGYTLLHLYLPESAMVPICFLRRSWAWASKQRCLTVTDHLSSTSRKVALQADHGQGSESYKHIIPAAASQRPLSD